MASLLDDACIHLARRAPAALIVLGLVAGCGGERPRTGGDTTATAVATPDSAAMPVANPTPPARDTTAATTPDTGAKPPAPAAPSKPAAPAAAPSKPSPAAATPSKPAPTAAAPSKPTPAATRPQSEPDVAAKPESTGAAAPAATAAQQQDTSGPPAEAPLRDAYHQAPRDTVTQTVYNGWKQFNLNCARCHGEDVLGTTIAPHLIMSLKPDGPINTKELFVQTVCAGRPAKGMPAWCALGLDMNKINDIYQYVKGRSDAKIGPGRPAVKQEG